MLRAALTAILALGITQASAQDPDLIERGWTLFNDKSLSGAGEHSCATCHPGGGHTTNKNYVGLDVVPLDNENGRSAPTLWGGENRSLYGWTGGTDQIEVNMRGIIVNRMKGPEPSEDTLAALKAYIGSLTPRPAAYIDEDGFPLDSAPASVQRGSDLFLGLGGCGTCHIPGTFDKDETEDVGSGGMFKVPSLWAVGLTAPYFHDGRYATLEETVRNMWHTYWRSLEEKGDMPAMPSDAQTADLVAYLNAL